MTENHYYILCPCALNASHAAHRPISSICRRMPRVLENHSKLAALTRAEGHQIAAGHNENPEVTNESVHRITTPAGLLGPRPPPYHCLQLQWPALFVDHQQSLIVCLKA
eukprot:1158612-Pelagomonas_calceolata.AAC.3